MKTIFIDFGNVIGFFDHSRAVRRLTAHSPLDAAALDRAVYGGQAMDHYESGLITSAEFYRISRDVGHLNCSEAEFYDCFADIFARNDEVCDLVPMLGERYRLVLASNTSDAHYRRYCKDYADVLHHFSGRVASHEALARKPDARFYRRCGELAEALPHECAFIDDLTKNIDAAEAFGFRGLLYRPGDGLKEKLAALGILPAAASDNLAVGTFHREIG